ncbi:LacI family DNA-binding transcriptional regulator [Buchananella hordeovulneris]|uniref:HTH lacI-type domain-containing protein n=1 Tax=Buchananella hordeovulneris TaxID=52770 RepID=A0A1Q5PYA0_9ACTO|nr:LacI family DNA-binding transcriptional regulator [Buchananella hordeovulneris]OKL52442.1 hypothetical protein BSZ40_02955 [Buchananella hordeovulneris]RRD45364.1 LacI family transcriptional regulator [Buchananella hordeovulneris]
MKDVAARAAVSIGTVSHVLNHPERVASTTRARVEAAIVELGFVPSEAARRLRRGSSPLVGVIVLDLGNPLCAATVRAIEDELRQQVGCLPIIYSSDGRAESEAEIMRTLAAQEVRAAVVWASEATAANLPILTARNIHTVLIDHPPLPTTSTVQVDDEAGAATAVAHLLAQGHRRIGLINGPTWSPQAQTRRAGAVRALQEADLAPAEALVEVSPSVTGRGFTAADGSAAAAELLSLPARPTGIFCAGDLLAIGAMREIKRRGHRVPDDFAVVGYDDIFVAGELITPLTTVRWPAQELGRAAAQLIEQQTVGHVSFTPQLVIRESA